MGTIVVSREFKRRSGLGLILSGTWALLSGLWLTLKRMIYNLWHRKDSTTVEYPSQKVKRSSRFRGVHVLTKKADGEIRCTACMLCATACPAECIRIVASENENPDLEKSPSTYEIDSLRCVFCGFCEEACPVDAIRMTPEYETSNVSASNFIWDINFLMNRPSLKGGVTSRCPEDRPHHQRVRKGLTAELPPKN